MASLLAFASVEAASIATRAAAAAGSAAVAALGLALLRCWRAVVGPAVGLLAFAALGGVDRTLAFVPLEAAALVAVALLAWWSIDERWAIPGDPDVHRGRTVMSIVLVLAAAAVSGLVVAMASEASPRLVAPSVGAVGVASAASVLWAVARLRRWEAARRS